MRRVYVLLRGKAGQAPEQRLAKLLHKPIFHQVRDSKTLLDKVVAVSGDITLPGLGLSAASVKQIKSEVQFILHTAADIRLEIEIQPILTSNYFGTEAVLQLAQECTQLKAMVHTSSCFVNMNLPRSSVIDSRIYPLRLGERDIKCQEFVQVREWVWCWGVVGAGGQFGAGRSVRYRTACWQHVEQVQLHICVCVLRLLRHVVLPTRCNRTLWRCHRQLLKCAPQPWDSGLASRTTTRCRNTWQSSWCSVTTNNTACLSALCGRH